jgi:ferric-dicitrate binding protein FerR (iron transport regulator)
MLFDRPSGTAPEALRIRGDFGVIAVRGTRFFVGPSQGKLAIFVDRGGVSVSSGGSTVVLGPGQGTDIVRRGARPAAVQTWGQGRIAEALGLVQ